jgi:hypothetical protein
MPFKFNKEMTVPSLEKLIDQLKDRDFKYGSENRTAYPWTEEEDKFIMLHPQIKNEVIAKKLKRTEMSIKSRKDVLKSWKSASSNRGNLHHSKPTDLKAPPAITEETLMSKNMIDVDLILARMMKDVLTEKLYPWEAKKIYSYLKTPLLKTKTLEERDSPLIRVLKLSARPSNALLAEKITHLAQLTRFSRKEIMRFPNIGKTAMDEIELALKNAKLELETEWWEQITYRNAHE